MGKKIMYISREGQRRPQVDAAKTSLAWQKHPFSSDLAGPAQPIAPLSISNLAWKEEGGTQVTNLGTLTWVPQGKRAPAKRWNRPIISGGQEGVRKVEYYGERITEDFRESSRVREERKAARRQKCVLNLHERRNRGKEEKKPVS